MVVICSDTKAGELPKSRLDCSRVILWDQYVEEPAGHILSKADSRVFALQIARLPSCVLDSRVSALCVLSSLRQSLVAYSYLCGQELRLRIQICVSVALRVR